MRHRGPAMLSRLEVSCSGSNRLSIIDIAHSHQPRWWGPEAWTATCWCSTARSTTTSLELRDELRTQHGAVFATDGDGEAILAGWVTTGAPRCCSGCAACSHSRCGTPSPRIAPAREIRSASSRCLSPPSLAARRWPVRRNACRVAGFTEIDHRALQHYAVLVRAGTRDIMPWGTSAESGCFCLDPADQLAPVTPLFRATGQSDHQRQRPGPL